MAMRNEEARWRPWTVVLGLAAVATPAQAANTLQVGPGQTYAKPCQAIAAAQPGDTIAVDASGNYDGDTCAWTTDGLTLRGVNGRAKIDLTGVTPAQQKGIFVIGGTASATIEYFELSGAAISASAGNNGAGIRHQGKDLTVRGCYFHDNQDGILAAPATANTGTVTIESSEFSHNGAGDGYSHNMYIGNFASFTLEFSYSHRGNVGHLFKSRAFVTSVLYNRITDETGGTASYEVDIPNGGTAYVIGNVIEQSATTQNPAVLSFGEEGTPAGYDTHLFVVNNTFLDDLGHGTFVVDSTATPATIENNIFHGGAAVTGQTGAALTTNFESSTGGSPMFADLAAFDVSLLAGSPCIDRGTAPGSGGSQGLSPVFEYVHPVSGVPRTVVGSAIDIGAYEYGLPDAGVIGPDASPPDSGASSGGGSRSGSSGASGSGGGGGPGSSGGGIGNGASGSGGGTGGEGGPSSGAPPAPGSSGGCGCKAANAPAEAAAGFGGTMASLTLMVARRRLRRRRLHAPTTSARGA